MDLKNEIIGQIKQNESNKIKQKEQIIKDITDAFYTNLKNFIDYIQEQIVADLKQLDMSHTKFTFWGKEYLERPHGFRFSVGTDISDRELAFLVDGKIENPRIYVTNNYDNESTMYIFYNKEQFDYFTSIFITKMEKDGIICKFLQSSTLVNSTEYTLYYKIYL